MIDIKNMFLTRCAFVYLVELKSFTKAAEKLQVSKSAISKYIVSLEEELDTALVSRTTRNTIITDKGQILYEQFRPILRLFEESESVLSDEIRQMKGQLRVTFPESVAVLVEKTVGNLSTKYPYLRFELMKEDKRLNLMQNYLDMAISVGKLSDSSMQAVLIGKMDEVLVGHREIIDLSKININNVHQLPYIENSWEKAWVDASISNKKIRIKKNVVCQVNSLSSLLELINLKTGIGRVPTYHVRKQLEDKIYKEVLPSLQIAPAPIYLVHPFKSMPEKVRVFRDEIQKVWQSYGTTRI